MPRAVRISELLSKAQNARSPRLRALANLLRAESDPRVAQCLAEALSLAIGVETKPNDPIARAIHSMQSDLSTVRSVGHLAREVGLSRSAFARRFRDATGLPPERYAFELRMRRAQQLLRNEQLGLAGVAAEVGYRSEFAFGRAFKRWAGVSPGRYRKQSGGSVVCLAA